eukprot:CAMPEP_0172843374 /NCGR_PEP_ID=MMETSP1075-20121228/31411_1 /TAXON_ID=2916 /ORGANISM="Ceratium fusus, Strain PA161109" /LENGTH=92 /DNA_ID=CAMNT_0013687633 /DNA_START=35 /DNA_END=309 /DNA_ORIENTATION=+
MPVVPKKKFTRFMTHRRHLLQFRDHYRFLYKVRRSHFDRALYAAPAYEERYVPPPFRHSGFWPGEFGYPQAQKLRTPIPEKAASNASGEARG